MAKSAQTAESKEEKPALSYDDAVRLATIAESQVKGALVKALAELGSPELVRGRLDEPRVKSQSSLDRKAKERRWTSQQAIEQCEDLLGMRMVCNNLQDVRRAADLIELSLKTQNLEVERKDYISQPHPSGYRAIHVRTRFPITVGRCSLNVGCEIQIRTLLQDAWARLSREDLYRSSIPKRLRLQFEAMSKSLAEADAIAEEVRVDITRPVSGKEPGENARISESSLAFIYTRAFKEEPPSYLVEWMLKKISDARVRVDALDTILQDEEFFKLCQARYQETANWPADTSRLLEWAIEELLHGRERALTLARTQGQRDWEEIEAEYQSEIRATIPADWGEFEQELENGSLDLLELARYYGVAKECICGEDLIEYDDFIDAVQEHYNLSGDEAHTAYNTILTELNGSGYEDADGSRLCARCTHKMNKDD
jgi:putative GTP pyrophosphokinase